MTPQEIASVFRDLQRQVPFDRSNRLMLDALRACADLADLVAVQMDALGLHKPATAAMAAIDDADPARVAPAMAATKDSTIRSLHEQIEVLTEERRSSIKSSEHRIDWLQAECRARATERDAARATVADLEQRLAAADKRVLDAESKMEDVNRRLRELNKSLEALRVPQDYTHE